MKDFFNAYKAELYKSTRRYTIIKLIIAIAIIMLLLTVVYSFLEVILQSFGVADVNTPTFESNEQAVEILKEMIADHEAGINSGAIKNNGINNNTLYQYRAMLTKYQYLLDNNLSESDFVDFGIFEEANGVNYVLQVLQVVGEAVMVFAVIMCVRNYINEIHNGTMKMQLLRPVSRAKTFSAKYLSVNTISIATLVLVTIVAQIIGIARFGADSKQILSVVDASRVVIMSPFAVMTLEFLEISIRIFAVCQLTYFVSNIFSGRNTAIVITLLLMFFGGTIEGLLAYGYVGYVGFVSNFDFLRALTISGPSFRGMRLWSMLLICGVWLAVMMTFNYLSFKNKDIN